MRAAKNIKNINKEWSVKTATKNIWASFVVTDAGVCGTSSYQAQFIFLQLNAELLSWRQQQYLKRTCSAPLSALVFLKLKSFTYVGRI